MADEVRRDDREQTGGKSKDIDFTRMLVRFVATAVILAIAAFLTPGFRIDGIWALVIAAVVITVVDYFIERFTGIDASPFGRGIVGFAVAAAVIYFTQFIVAGYAVSFWGAIIGALIIGILNAIIPGRAL